MIKILAPILLLLLGGCATKYQNDGLTGGFTETQLDANVFKVSFNGNTYTTPERAEELALLRSAELTLKHGFTHFVITEGRSKEHQITHTTPVQSYTTANATSRGKSTHMTSQTTTYGGDTYTTSMPSTTNTIMCFPKKPDMSAVVYDAGFLCKSLGQKYKVVCRAR